MKFPKMSAWVIALGVWFWLLAVGLYLATTLSLNDYGWLSGPGQTIEVIYATYYLFDTLLIFPIFLTILFTNFEMARIKEILMIAFMIPYVAIPFWWFILHQIDKAMKRRRGGKLTSTGVAGSV